MKLFVKKLSPKLGLNSLGSCDETVIMPAVVVHVTLRFCRCLLKSEVLESVRRNTILVVGFLVYTTNSKICFITSNMEKTLQVEGVFGGQNVRKDLYFLYGIFVTSSKVTLLERKEDRQRDLG